MLSEQESSPCLNPLVAHRRRRPKRQREKIPSTEAEVHASKAQRKRLKPTTSNSFFDVHMMDDMFLLLLRFFVSDSGVVDGEALRSIMLVSKRWYKVASTKTLWAPAAKSDSNDRRIPHRPSPWISDMCPSARFPNLIGFANLGMRKTDDGRPSFTARERATGKLFTIDILDSDDSNAVRSAASAHYLQGDKFVTNRHDEQYPFLLPVGLESSNGKVVRWFKHAISLSEWYRTEGPSQLEAFKELLRQMLKAIREIHAADIVHGSIDTSRIYVDSSTVTGKPRFLLDCSTLFPVTSQLPSLTRCLQNTSPELLIPLSRGLRIRHTPEGDIWSLGCIMAELIQKRAPLFGPYSNGSVIDENIKLSVARYARTVCRVVGRPPSFSSVMRSQKPNEFPSSFGDLRVQANLGKELGSLDETGIDLMTSLLSSDPVKRPTAEEALAHPFLSERGSTTRSPINASITQGHELRHLILLHRSREPQLCPTRRSVRQDAWATLVDYVIEIVEVFDLEVAAAFRAMSYFDRFFSSYPGSDSFTSLRCQLVAGTCLYIATKCDQTRLTKSDLAFCADNTFDDNDISIAEAATLEELQWMLSYPTILDFVEYMCNALELDKRDNKRMMAYYIAELALQCQVYRTYQSSLIASCVVVLTLVATETTNPWPNELSQATGYSWNDLEECVLALSSGIQDVRATMPELKIITRKYRKAEYGRVARIRIPIVTNFASLRNHNTER